MRHQPIYRRFGGYKRSITHRNSKNKTAFCAVTENDRERLHNAEKCDKIPLAKFYNKGEANGTI